MEKVAIENVLRPGKSTKLDAAKYEAMKRAYLVSAPPGPPGLTAAEMGKAVRSVLSQDLFPGGAKAGWWTKAVQLDLEAKGILKRSTSSPLRFYKA